MTYIFPDQRTEIEKKLREHKPGLYVFYGTGSNEKTTFINQLRDNGYIKCMVVPNSRGRYLLSAYTHLICEGSKSELSTIITDDVWNHFVGIIEANISLEEMKKMGPGDFVYFVEFRGKY